MVQYDTIHLLFHSIVPYCALLIYVQSWKKVLAVLKVTLINRVRVTDLFVAQQRVIHRSEAYISRIQMSYCSHP